MATCYLRRLRLAGAQANGDGYAALDPDVDNLRTALSWARRSDPAAIDVAAVASLHRFYELRGRFAEGRATMLALADAGAAGAARALLHAGQLSQYLGDLDEAERLTTRGQAALAPDDHGGHAVAGLVLGTRAHKLGDPGAAMRHIAAALRAARTAGDERMIGWALNNLAAVTGQAGDFLRAEHLMRQALDAKQRANADNIDIGRTLASLADLALVNGGWSEAADYAVRGVAMLDSGGHTRLQASALSSLALARLRGGHDGDPDGASRAMRQALALLDSFGEDRWLRGLVRARHSVVLHAAGQPGAVTAALAEAVRTMRSEPLTYHLPPVIEAHAALLAGTDPAAAAMLLGLAEAIRRRPGIPPAVPPRRAQPLADARTEAVCRRRLDPAVVAHHRQRGAALLVDGLASNLTTVAGIITESHAAARPAAAAMP